MQKTRCGLESQKAVNCFCGQAGGLGQALGSAAGGAGQCHAHAARQQQRHQRAQAGGFAGAGPASDDGNFVVQRKLHGGGLLCGHFNAGLHCKTLHGQRLLAHGIQAGCFCLQQTLHTLRHTHLRPVKLRKIDGALSTCAARLRPARRQLLCKQRVAVCEARQHRCHHRSFNSQQLHRLQHQLAFRAIHMAVAGALMQAKRNAGPDARRRIQRQAQRLRQIVRRLKANAPNVARQPVRILLHHLQRVVTVLAVHLQRQSGAQAVPLQKNHQVLFRALLVPGVRNQGCALHAKARHLAQAPGILLNDLQRVHAKVLHNALGSFWANAFNESRAKIAADAFQRGRRQHRAVLRAKLPAVFRVAAPRASKAQIRAGL